MTPRFSPRPSRRRHGTPCATRRVPVPGSSESGRCWRLSGAGVSLTDGDGALHFLTATDGRADRVEQVQVALQDGPCLTAVRTGRLVTVDDLAQDDRWPEYRGVALDAGYRAVIGVPQALDDQLQHALDARVVIEQARGLLAGAHDISPSVAYERLRAHTRHHRLRVREVARRIVDGTLALPDD